LGCILQLYCNALLVEAFLRQMLLATKKNGRSRSASVVWPSTRFNTGALYQEWKKIPIFPRGGRMRQKRHISGLCRSSSDEDPIARVWMCRGSIHSISVWTTSRLPDPTAQESKMMT
jgi:hypothetical protein